MFQDFLLLNYHGFIHFQSYHAENGRIISSIIRPFLLKSLLLISGVFLGHKLTELGHSLGCRLVVGILIDGIPRKRKEVFWTTDSGFLEVSHGD